MTRTEKLLLAIALVFVVLAAAFVPRGNRAESVEPAFARPMETPAVPEEGVWVRVSVRMDLNTAEADELTAIPGVGRATAEAIVAWREENGPFTCAEDLLRVPGVRRNVLESLEYDD